MGISRSGVNQGIVDGQPFPALALTVRRVQFFLTSSMDKNARNSRHNKRMQEYNKIVCNFPPESTYNKV